MERNEPSKLLAGGATETRQTSAATLPLKLCYGWPKSFAIPSREHLDARYQKQDPIPLPRHRGSQRATGTDELRPPEPGQTSTPRRTPH